jgi:hypothetical protein
VQTYGVRLISINKLAVTQGRIRQVGLTWLRDGYYTGAFGSKAHAYPEEIFVVSGRLYDEAFAMWLEPGYYASRPPGEVHGPFRAEGDVLIYENSFPSQSIDK